LEHLPRAHSAGWMHWSLSRITRTLSLFSGSHGLVKEKDWWPREFKSGGKKEAPTCNADPLLGTSQSFRITFGPHCYSWQLHFTNKNQRCWPVVT
jgi:hypothetical protein